MSYFMFHKVHAPDGQLFEDGVTPQGDGWVDTPAAFEPGYVPPPAEPEGLPERERRAGYVPQAFPSHRYRKGDPDNPILVQSAEDAAALDPAEWKDTPDPAAWVEQPSDPVSGKKAKR